MFSKLNSRSQRANAMCLFVTVVAVTSYFWIADGREPSHPFTIDRDVLDLGRGNPGGTLTGTVVLSNPHSHAVRFYATRSCGCSAIHPLEGEIAAGGTQNVSSNCVNQ